MREEKDDMYMYELKLYFPDQEDSKYYLQQKIP